MPEAQVWVGGNAGGLRLHFEHFEELGISQTFSLQKYFFFNRVLNFTIFLELKCGMSLFKTIKG